MKTRNKKTITSLGVAAAIVLAAPLAANEDTARQDRTQQSQAQQSQDRTQQSRGTMFEGSMNQHGDSSYQSKKNKPRSSSDIIGMDIQSATGDKIGQVDDLFVDMESGKIVAMVTSTGGILGAGAEKSLLSYEDVRFDGEEKHLRSNLTKEQLKSAPRYREGDTSEFDNVRPLGDRSAWQSDDRGTTGSARQSEADRTRARSGDASYQRDSDGRDASETRSQSANRGAVTSQSGDRNRDHDLTPATPKSAADRGSMSASQRSSSGDAAYQRDSDRRDSSARSQSDDRGRDRGMTGTTRQRETDRDRSESSAAYQGDSDGKQDHSAAKKMAVSDLIGMDIKNRAGDNIGSIDKLYLDFESGQVLGVVVSTGGFLGMGAHQNVLALNELDYNAEEETLSVNMDREQLRKAPTYNEDDSSWHAELRERSNRGSERGSAGRTSAGPTTRSAQPDSGRPTTSSQSKE